MIDKPLQQVKDPETLSIFQHIFSEAEGRQKDLLTETPSVKNVDEKSFKLYLDGATLKLYTKINGTLKYISFT